LAGAARRDEREDDVIALGEFGDAFADLGDHPGAFVAAQRRQADRGGARDQVTAIITIRQEHVPKRVMNMPLSRNYDSLAGLVATTGCWC
jgi:hypothetical protein